MRPKTSKTDKKCEDRLTTCFWPYLIQFLSDLHDLGLILKLTGQGILTRTRPVNTLTVTAGDPQTRALPTGTRTCTAENPYP